MISRPLRTSKGENTSAAWGVANFLLRLREKYRPDYVAWINDAGTSFREERYPDYKSTREKLDEELQADFDRALERIRSLLEAFRVPLLTVPGYEADDVIGTLATTAAGRGLQAVIVSGDKDFYQLIGPGVALLNPGRGGPAAVEETWVDESNAGERLGVPPSQVVDFLALVGDSSDNVPGVKGIGEKGAQKLLLEYGDLDAILAHASEVSAKRTREALLGQADNARLCRELVTIKRDVPVELDVSRLTLQEPDQEAAVRILTELEFYSLARKLAGQGSAAAAAPAGDGAAPPPSPAATTDEADAAEPAPSGATLTADDWLALDSAPQVTVSVIDDPAEIPALVERLRRAPLVALDVETSSIEPRDAEIVGLSLAASPDRGLVSPARPSARRRRARGTHRRCGTSRRSPTRRWRRSGRCSPTASVPKAGHDIKYDWQVLRGAGIELDGVAYDTMLASFVLDPGRRSHAIDNLCLEHLGRAMKTYADVAGRGKTEIPFAEVAILAAAEYCGTDAGTVLALHEFFAPSLREMAAEPLLREIEMPLVEVLVDMEWEGIRIDRELFARLSGELAADLRRLEEEIARVAGMDLNLNSPRQLATVLFEKHQLPILKKTKTGPSTDADVLEQLAAMGHDLPRLILDYRELQKLKSTYVDALPAADQRPDRPDPHQLQPGRCRHRPAQQLRAQPAEHPGPDAPRRGDPARVRAAGGLGLPGGGLLPDRAAADGASVRGSGVHRGVPPGRRHPPADRGAHLRRAGRAGDLGDAGPGQDHQLRHHLRAGPLRAEPAARHQSGGRAGVHRPLLRALRRGARLPRSAGEAGAGAGLRGDAVQAAALHPRDPGSQLQPARLRGAHRAELAPAGQRRRSHQARHDPHPRRDPGGGAGEPDAAAGARRAGLRGAARRAGHHARPGAHPYGGGGGAGRAAGGGLGVGPNWLEAKR